MAFDPDAYLAEGGGVETATSFDPDAYLGTQQPAEEEGFLRQAADIPVNIFKGGVTGVRMVTDVFGAANPISKSLAGVEDYMDTLLSAQAKQDQQEIARILKDAEDKGVLDQVMAGVAAFSVAPADTLANAFGTMIPVLATGLAGSVARLAPVAVKGVQLGMGAAMGAGTIKGEIYNSVYSELENQGVDPKTADKQATQAQAYGGKNLDQILLGAGLGAAAASTGAEKILTNVITKAGGKVSGGAIAKAIKGGITEAVPEAAQGGQEKLATNIALQREGIDVPTMRGVVAQATMEGIAGLGMGAAVGPLQPSLPDDVREQRDIERDAEKVARELSVDPNDTNARGIVNETNRLEQKIQNNQVLLNGMEPTSREHKRLSLEIAEDQKNLAALKGAVDKLSEPIAAAEAEQARLAREIAEEPTAAPSVTEKRNKDLFPDTTDFAGKLPTDVRINTYTEKDGIGTAEYVNPANGSTDVYISAFGDNDFIAYIRIYDEQGNPTNRFASKLERRTERAGASRAMIEELQRRLPAEHEYTEDVSASTDGLRFISSQLQRGYELVTDDKGNVETNRIAINGESIVNDLGADVIRQGQEFADIQVTNRETFERVRGVIAPLLERFNAGLGEGNIYWENGRVYVDIPVLRKATPTASVKPSAKPKTKIPPPPTAIITDSTTAEQIASEISIRRNALNTYDFGTEANKKLEAEISNLEAELQLRKEAVPAEPTAEVSAPTVEAAPVEPTAAVEEAPIEPVAEAPAITPAPVEEVAIPVSDKKDWVIKATKEGLFPDKITFQELRDEAFNYGAMDGDWLGGLEPQGNKGDLPARQDIEDVFGRKFTDEEFLIIQQEYVNGVNEMEAMPTPQPSAPAPEVAFAQRDVTKPEQMTPDEAIDDALRKAQIRPTETGFMAERDRAIVGSNAEEIHYIAVSSAIESLNPVSAEAVESYGITLPKGYTKQGDLYVYQPTEAPTPTAPTPAAPAVGNRIKLGKSPQTYTIEEVIPQSETERELGEQYYSVKNEKTGEVQTVEAKDIKPVKAKGVRKMAARVKDESLVVPEADRYTFEQAEAEARKLFGGMPEGFIIVNDSVDPEYEFKAGYEPDSGDIILNLAYIRKGESVRNLIAHELGHYAAGDPEIRAKLQEFLDALPPATRSRIERFVERFYNEDTGDMRLEEKQVRAFVQMLKAGDQRNAFQKLIDAVKKWLNDKLGTNFQPTEMDAAAVLSGAINRFNAGEFIAREDGAMSPMDRDYLDAVERGDMETAQRMVDEAAKRAGFFIKAFHGSLSKNITQFKNPTWVSVDKEYAQDYATDYSADYDPFAETGKMTEGKVYPVFVKQERVLKLWSFRNWLDLVNKIAPQNNNLKNLILKSEGFNTWDEYRNYFKDEPKKTNIQDHYKWFRDGHDLSSTWEEIKPGANFADKKDLVNELFDLGYDTLAQLETSSIPKEGAAYLVKTPSKQLKSAEPVTYDDAGNVIPLSQRFRPEKKDIRYAKVERYDERSQVASVKGIGAMKDTPKGINTKTEKIIKDQVFDSDTVSDNQTKKAWNLISRLQESNPEAGKNAQAINELTRETMQDVEAEDIVKQTIGATKLRNELFKYAIKLTAEGDRSMLDYLLNNRLAIAGGAITEGDAGRLLQALSSLKSWIQRSSEAEQTGFFTIAAQQFFDTKNPTDKQIKQIQDMFEAVKKVKVDQEKDLMTELEEVGKATGIDLPAVVQKQLDATPGLDPTVVAMINMIKLAGGGRIVFEKFPSPRGEAVKKTILGGLADYRKKMVGKGATGLETGFWKTLSDKEEKPGPLGELDAYQNRELGNIVKSTLIGMGLKGTPPDTKMTIYEQVATILGEQPLGSEKIKMADDRITASIGAKREAEVENARSEEEVDAINAKYDQIQFAWDEAMSRQTEMPVSDALIRRLIFAELKEADTSIADIATLMDEEPAIGASRQDTLVRQIIEKIVGSNKYVTWLTSEGKREGSDYGQLQSYLSEALESMVIARQQKNRTAKSMASIKRQAAGDPTKQAQAQIDKLAKIQADPTIFGEKRIDPVRNAVRDALSLQLNIGFTPEQTADIKRTWKGAYVADPNQKGLPSSFMLEMQRLGVKESAADILAEIVWKQIEVNAMNKQMDATTKAVEAGPIGGMVQAILDTPLAMQQDPDWQKKVILDYLKNAGVKPAQAEKIASLFDISLRKRFAQAQEQAAEKAAKAIMGKLTPNSRRALQKFMRAIRAQVLNPGTDVAKAFGEQMGWKGFTKEDITRLNELDSIVNDSERTDAEVTVAIEQINQIIDKVSMPPQVKDVISSYYVGNILGRFTTFAIQAVDPLMFTTFDAAVKSFTNITNPAQLMSVWANYGRAVSNLIRETAFSFKNDVLRSGKMIDYMNNEDRKIGRLWREAERKYKAGDIKGAMKGGIIGYTSQTFRILKALDDGAYSLLITNTLPSYVDAALKRAKVPRDKRRGVMRRILEAREIDIKNFESQGVPRNDAIVYANERMTQAVQQELGNMKLPEGTANEVVNSALNDALSRIGKTRFMEDVLGGDKQELKDEGFFSSIFLRFYENVAKSVNQKGGSEWQKIFYRVLLGFPLIPARIFNISAGYTPLTIYRHLMPKRYSLTYGTSLQRRQRLLEQMAGTMVLLPLLMLRSSSFDDEEEKKRGFGVYITGQGPSRAKDKETHAQWNRRHKPYSIEVVVGGKKASIDAKSSGPLAVMIYTLGALDDWQIRRIQDGMKTSKEDLKDIEEKSDLFTALYDLAGSFVLTTARRGPTTGVMQGLVNFQRYPDDPIAAIGQEAAFAAAPAIPILGTGITKNLSDFFSEPIDNRTKEGALISNFPIVGPVLGQPALNAYGQKIGELHVSEKLKKSFGIPFTLVPTENENDYKLSAITLKFGNGPTHLRREAVEAGVGRAITDEEWYKAATAYGKYNREKILESYDYHFGKSQEKFDKTMTKMSETARKRAIEAVTEKTP